MCFFVKSSVCFFITFSDFFDRFNDFFELCLTFCYFLCCTVKEGKFVRNKLTERPIRVLGVLVRVLDITKILMLQIVGILLQFVGT